MGSQRLFEGICTQTISRVKYNKDVKIRKADFSLMFREAEHITRAKREHHFSYSSTVMISIRARSFLLSEKERVTVRVKVSVLSV